MKTEILKTYNDMRWLLPKASPLRRLRLAVLKHKVMESMRNGFCYFTYKKANGEIRETLATLDTEVKPPYNFVGGKSEPKNAALLITTWDKEACMWRTFRVDRIVRFWI